jgi:endonuclease G
MVPQNPENNRGVWEGIESTVRKLAKERGDLYIVSGPIYQGDNILRIGGAVMVPTQIYKAIYDPARQEAGAYLVDNAAGARPVRVSIADLEKITGISLFPGVSDRAKANAMRLPEPKTYKERKKRRY